MEKNKTIKNRNNSGKSSKAGQINSTAHTGLNFNYDMQQFPTLPGNIPVEIPPTATHNWPYSRTGGMMHHGNTVPNAQWNALQNRNALGGNLLGNMRRVGNMPLGIYNPGITMQDTFNVPTSSRQNNVKIIDRLGADVFAQQY